MRDEILTLFLAGHETTALGLTWSWYLLSRNPEIELRFQDAADSGDGDFIERVFAEALRLYPPAWAIGRINVEPYELAGQSIAAGAVFVLSPWLMQRDPRFWPDPLHFDPDRFLPQNRSQQPKFTYFPFGGGVRACIGERFAWMESRIVLAVLGRTWAPRPAGAPTVDVRPLITLRPRRPVRMILQRRSLSALRENADKSGEACRDNVRSDGRDRPESHRSQL